MNARRFLQQIEFIDKKINSKLKEKEHWKDISTAITSSTKEERVQRSVSPHKISNSVAHIVDIEAEVNKDIEKLIEAKKEVSKVIEQLNPKEYEVMHRIYIQLMTFKDIASELDRSYRWVVGTHRQGLVHVQEILNRKESEREL